MRALYDPYFKIRSEKLYKQIYSGLEAKSYDVVLARPRKYMKKKYRKNKEFRDYKSTPWVDDVYKKNDLIVSWGPGVRRELDDRFNTPILSLFGGFLPESWTCDLGGFLGASSWFVNIAKELDELMGDKYQSWGRDYGNMLSKQNKSKRSQSKNNTIISKPFVFLPMQHMKDYSVRMHGNTTYPQFMLEVGKFCAERKLGLAIKKHPNLVKKPTRKIKTWRVNQNKEMDRIFKKIRKSLGDRLVIVEGSIHHFCKNSVFMAGMNTGTVVDAFMNSTIVSHCGKSIFVNSGAVLHNDNIQECLHACVDLPNDKKEYMMQRQKACLYWLYNRYSLLAKGEKNSELSNTEKIVRALSV